jgi:hypothetical protein
LRGTAVSAARRLKDAVAMLVNDKTGAIPHLIASKAPAAPFGPRRPKRNTLPVGRWEPVLGVLAVLALVGVITVRSRNQSVQISKSARAAQRESPLSAPASEPSSPTSRFGFDVPGGRAAGPLSVPANEAASDARPQKRAAQPPTSLGAATGQFGPAQSTGTPGTTGSSLQPRSVKELVQERTGGVLAIDSDPSGSAVFVDRDHVGETPIQLTRLRAGSHVIWVEHDGYDRWTTAALVPTYKQTRVRAKLQPVR